MVYLVVPEERLLELIALPKRTIVERLIRILKECDTCVSDSDGDCDSGDSVQAQCDASGETESDSGVESNEHSSGSLLPDQGMADVDSKDFASQA